MGEPVETMARRVRERAGTTHAATLRTQLDDRTARVGLIGLGYAGLPLAVAFAEAGFAVTGVDLDARRVASLQAGRSYLGDITDATIARLVEAERLTATTDYAALHDVDAVTICVPTPLSKTKSPDISAIVGALEALTPQLRPGQLIVLESTTYPGTTEEVLRPALEAEGLVVGETVFLAFAPERVNPGDPDFGTKNTSKLVGGSTPACRDLAVALYQTIVDEVVPVSSPTVAETAKLLENTFRQVNVALANEMALMCRRLGIDVWEVIEAAATKPFGFMPFYPGPGLGGHCIPIVPHYLAWKLKGLGYEAQFIALAETINAAMPAHVVELTAAALDRPLHEATVLVLGVTYKRDVADTRESPALEVVAQLLAAGATVWYHDPYVPVVEVEGRQLHSRALTDETVARADGVVIATDHSAYDWRWLGQHARLIVDTRNAMRAAPPPRARVVKL